jgi:hypothetical protein
MKSLRNQSTQPASVPLIADDILEFHAARLLLLIAICGTNDAISSLTKLAKLDFFVRYPDFFLAASIADDKNVSAPGEQQASVEAAMVRHHYGPWDKRYYHILAFLEARGLITIRKSGRSFRIALTKLGKNRGQRLGRMPAFAKLHLHMEAVGAAFRAKTGNELKTLIYQTFDEEIRRKPIGHVIG